MSEIEFPEQTIEELQKERAENWKDAVKSGLIIRQRFEALRDRLDMMQRGMTEALEAGSVVDLIFYFKREMESDVRYDRSGDLVFNIAVLVSGIKLWDVAIDQITLCDAELSERGAAREEESK
jgi:hypothetical protein